MDNEKQKSFIGRILNDLPAEFIKGELIKYGSYLLFFIFVPLAGLSTITAVFPFGFQKVDIHAKLKGRILPGESIELYPPSRAVIVPANGEVVWESVPFEEIAGKTIQLQHMDLSQGSRKNREIVYEQKIDKNPMIILVLEK